MSVPRRAIAVSAQPEPGKRIVSVRLAAILSIALFALFRPADGAGPASVAAIHPPVASAAR